MLFNSYAFILYFLPLTLLCYFGLQRFGKDCLAKAFLILASLFFYGYFKPFYVLILIVSVLLNYTLSRGMFHPRAKHAKKALLLTGILCNLGLIFYFKYFHFFAENVNALLGTRLLPLPEILMPLGISFFTFQQISYLVDSYRGDTADHKFLDYALFVTFFPQLIAGPIVLHGEMLPQFRDRTRRKPDADAFAKGLWLFSVGLFKKVMIADVLSKGVDWGFSNVSALTTSDALFVSLLYTFQIYFDFSGYCDMAMGIASLFHFELPLNFNSPYKARSIGEFWQRWHVTLYRFLRQYVYFPLGGSRRGMLITCRNVMIVFLVSGIWHGAAWTFLLWGVLHGLASVLHRLISGVWKRIPGLFQWFFTFSFVNFAWVIFRAKDLGTVKAFFSRLLFANDLSLSNGLLAQLRPFEYAYLEKHVGLLQRLTSFAPWLPAGLCLCGAALLALIPRNVHEKPFQPTVANALGTILLLTWSLLSLSSLTVFLYFNF